jgi:hypothetical protein
MDDRALTPPKQQHSMPSRYTQQSNDGRDVAGIVARLLLHYYSPGDLSEAARKAMAQDWVEDLVEFGPTAVAHGCREWRQTQSKRPTPADIRRLCIESQNRRRENAVRSLPPPARDAEPPPMSAEERAECIALADKAIANLRFPRESQPTGYCAVPHRKAREYTAAELRAGRIALGLEQADDTTTAATTAA